MDDVHEQGGGAAKTDVGPSEPTTDAQSGESTAAAQPSEAEMRAYEAELNRITSAEMIVQTAVSLINIGGRRLGLVPPGSSSEQATAAGGERDLEQVRDAIDGASALLPILERRMPRELGPLRDAIAQLQVAYAREAQNAAAATSQAATQPPPEQTKPAPATPTKPTEGEQQPSPGPAEASGRLWVPGR
jgi:hypothetical protein